MVNFLKILLAEQDKEIASITKNYLVSRGYSTVMCIDGDEALNQFKKEHFDFIIVDVDIPVVSGYELVMEIRKKNRDIPIIFIGTNIRQTEIIKGFNIGADDFITTPLSMEELGLRIEAIQKRTKTNEQKKRFFTIGSFTFDINHHLLIHKELTKKLTNKEVALLYLLCEYANRVVERSLALKRVWHTENYFNARNMDVYIGRLRKLLRLDPSVQIENVHGIGYKLVITTK